jgi:hypothetical protein
VRPAMNTETPPGCGQSVHGHPGGATRKQSAARDYPASSRRVRLGVRGGDTPQHAACMTSIVWRYLRHDNCYQRAVTWFGGMTREPGIKWAEDVARRRARGGSRRTLQAIDLLLDVEWRAAWQAVARQCPAPHPRNGDDIDQLRTPFYGCPC